MASFSSSAAADSHHRWRYDVFLSFRGKDTRDNFTSHLLDALLRKKINCFVDNNLERGEEITPSLLTAIERSRVSVVVFSKNYGSSPWCVDELAKILDCRKRYGQVVLPVFYRVDPSDVDQQSGSVADAIAELELNFKDKLDKVPSWRGDLTTAANISGWDSQVVRPESRLVNEIVEDILKKLNGATSGYATGLVGMDSRVQQVKAMLHIQSPDVYFLGIWGMGGLGKTTIAKAVYSDIFAQYEGCCFLENVREESMRHGGLVHLRGKLMSEILDDQNLHFSTFIVDRIRRTRVLLVLDDVSDVAQVEFLIGTLDLFGPGSKVILTSRDKQVLKGWVDDVYEVERLDRYEARLLFCSKAFKENCPKKDFVEESNMVVNYSQGNPLALKVLGSFFLGRKKEFWENALAKLERIFRPEIQDVLRISFDGLTDEEKNIFLDIACFFKGQEIDFVKGILDGCGFGTDIGISVLSDKCLLTVSENKIGMHDLLQEMAHEVVRQESIKDPGKRSRLWSPNDVYQVLTKNQGTERVEGIFLDVSGIRDMELDRRSFSRMHNLRLLKVYNSEDRDRCKVLIPFGMQFLSDALRYLHWDRYPLTSFPFNFWPENLVEVRLAYSNIEQLWGGAQGPVNLKEIDLTCCKNLKAIPDMSRSIKLEIINCANCTSLVEVPSSVQHLVNLTDLNLRGCSSLVSLPASLNIQSLETLNLSGCSSLEKCPQIMGCIAYLNLNETAIEELPQSVAYLSRLVALNAKGCKRLQSVPNLCQLEALVIVDLAGCSSITSLPEISRSVKHLYLSGTAVEELPCWIGNLSKLSSLDLTNCKRLKNLPDAFSEASSLEKLILRGCSSITQFPKVPVNIKELYLDETGIEEIPSSIEGLSQLVELHLYNCKSFRLLPDSICELRSLSKLNLSGCSKFRIFPQISKPMESLQRLYLDGTPISNFSFPSSITKMPRLSTLELGNCKWVGNLSDLYFPGDWSYWEFLSRLSLNDCNISVLPSALCSFASLEMLDLSGNKFRELPPDTYRLSELQYLGLKNCMELTVLPELPCQLERLDADNCQSLRKVCTILTPDSGNFFNFSFTGCVNLDKKALHEILAYALLKVQRYYKRLHNQKFLAAAVESSLCFPGSEIPEWFSCQNSGCSLTMQLPSNWTGNGSVGFSVCAVLALEQRHVYNTDIQLKCTFQFKIRGADSEAAVHHRRFGGGFHGGRSMLSNHLLFGCDLSILEAASQNHLTRTCNEVHIQFYPEDMDGNPLSCCNVIACGTSFIYAQVEEHPGLQIPDPLREEVLPVPFQWDQVGGLWNGREDRGSEYIIDRGSEYIIVRGDLYIPIPLVFELIGGSLQLDQAGGAWRDRDDRGGEYMNLSEFYRVYVRQGTWCLGDNYFATLIYTRDATLTHLGWKDSSGTYRMRGVDEVGPVRALRSFEELVKKTTDNRFFLTG